MIVKNEENNLGKCLNKVINFVDEIVIVDTGSTDKPKIAVSIQIRFMILIRLMISQGTSLFQRRLMISF